jgi:phosphomannomutase
LPALVNTPEIRIPCPEDRKQEVIEEVRTRLVAAGGEINDIDGMRVQLPEGWWLLRASNTQDVLVVRCEAASHEKLEELVGQVSRQLAASGLQLPYAP